MGTKVTVGFRLAPLGEVSLTLAGNEIELRGPAWRNKDGQARLLGGRKEGMEGVEAMDGGRWYLTTTFLRLPVTPAAHCPRCQPTG
ncbi:hypothetical protein C0Q70_19976 [Pomacea canaliculata]|uniref:Uncharacterized protein n=1 Tax=Pomacea canaliculata TaxID=400727 RepID=A0A2T7NE91_POMCA|nr:hypothetical protein C0Q70_19976 [Pomacea canaliculata]